jgi:hypothetical protein
MMPEIKKYSALTCSYVRNKKKIFILCFKSIFKKINFFFIFLFFIHFKLIFLIFSYHFDALILKKIKNKKNIILLYFQVKYTLKINKTTTCK